MSNPELKCIVEDCLAKFYPERYIPKKIVSTRDIYENRFMLKSINFNDYVLGYLTNIILADIKRSHRFRKYECLKVIKAIVKSKSYNQAISQEVVSGLFKIYKEFIFIENEDVQWCVSAIIKDQVLNESDIVWLISNYQKSEHLVNRLLRYPERNSLITDWAKEIYITNMLPDRLSELISLLIDEDIPSYVKERGNELIWAIYYCLAPDSVKQSLLKKYYSKENLESVLTVSSRLNLPMVIEFILEDFDKNAGSQ